MAIADTDPDTTPGHPEPRPDKTRRRRIGRGMRSVYKNRNDDGFNIMGFIVVMAATIIFGAIAWQPLTGVLDRTRTTTLNTNINTAAQLINRLYQDDATRLIDDADTTSGAPSTEVLRWLESESDALEWRGVWAVPAAADMDDTNTGSAFVRIQFIRDVGASDHATLVEAGGTRTTIAQTANIPVASPAAAPRVPWLRGNFYAARIRIYDGQNNWSCALIVPSANFDTYGGTNADTYTHVDPDTSGRVASTATGALTLQTAETLVTGIWFDTGDARTTSDGLHDCSPVDKSGTTTATEQAELPSLADGEWDITRNGVTPADVTLTRERP